MSAAATHAVDLQTLIHVKFNGDLESFIHAWDACLLAISPVTGPDFFYALLEPKLRECKQLSPAFAHLDGAEPLSNADQLTFIYNAARREIDNKRRDKIRRDLMKPSSSLSTALAAANPNGAEAKLAADAAAGAGNLSPRRPRIRSPRQAQTTALAAAQPQQPLPHGGTCYSFSKDGKCKFDNRCPYKHIDSTGKEVPKPEAAAKPKPQAKKVSGTPFPCRGSRRPPSKKAFE